jgi:hypothetical protein
MFVNSSLWISEMSRSTLATTRKRNEHIVVIRRDMKSSFRGLLMCPVPRRTELERVSSG